ncbi:MAG: 2-C-methyl-D-erythritol 4-phosphate cytidylyltransferase [Candidatus Omnitrophica bacterium]|nr:2-C-methyl-D-erythritol 4-phosphate cytidylyltransferase [Candidatus Omnitrophota bacterium]
MKTQVIIAAGGTGERMKCAVPKPLLLLAGVPIVVRTVTVFAAHPGIAGIILVVNEAHIGAYKLALGTAGFGQKVNIIPGGKTRTQSVRMGLRELDADTGMVLVHDAVRPFVTARMIDEGLAWGCRERAAVAAVPVKPTLKVVDPRTLVVKETLDRSLIWEIQTPQVFERALLEQAYQGDVTASDDAALVEAIGCKVKVFLGDYKNIKITTPEDMVIAEALLKEVAS